ARVSEECGDALFALLNVIRLAGVDPDVALADANAKFVRRLEDMERRAAAAGRSLEDLDLAELDSLWQVAKSLESPPSRGGEGFMRLPANEPQRQPTKGGNV